MKAGARLLQGRPTAGAALRGWPSMLSLAAHGAAIALALWLAAMLRSLPQAAPQAGVPVVFRAAPSMAPSPGVPAAPQPLAAMPLPATPPSPPPLVAAAAPPAMPSPPEPLATPAVPAVPAPPARPTRQQDVAKSIMRPAIVPPSPRVSAAAPSTAPTAALSAAAPSAAAVSAPLLPPRPVAEAAGNAPPTYPERARRRGQQGRVVLRVTVSPTGRPLAVTVVRSSGYRMLDTAAADAVRQWHFVPASRGGVPHSGVAEVPVQFVLEN